MHNTIFWKIVISQLFEKVSQTKDFKYIEQASNILKTISEKKSNGNFGDNIAEPSKNKTNK